MTLKGVDSPSMRHQRVRGASSDVTAVMIVWCGVVGCEEMTVWCGVEEPVAGAVRRRLPFPFLFMLNDGGSDHVSYRPTAKDELGATLKARAFKADDLAVLTAVDKAEISHQQVMRRLVGHWSRSISIASGWYRRLPNHLAIAWGCRSRTTSSLSDQSAFKTRFRLIKSNLILGLSTDTSGASSSPSIISSIPDWYLPRF